MAVDSSFTGWPASALDFYRGLEADNSKAYWTAHQGVYKSGVRVPMEALLADLADEFGPGRIFRPYRDIRFSADKSPYKTAMGATLGRGGFVQLSAHGLAVGAGHHMMAPDQLERYRAAVADESTGERLRDVVARLEAQGIGLAAGERLKTAPRGYPRDHPRAELLRNKGLAAWKQWPDTPWLHTGEAQSRIVGVLRAARPLTDWLDENVGAAAASRRR